ncbi:hypothetical protein NDU88_001487 [Pleurodeles waltl]|uniref:Uncharacterized protein n=1 Tax=Pleurodeles waltl TaxID=8319 RepID=A0AAV7MNV7_PLEWA|nr:hypothetical protein NDU88_001487 [Pleurodeles waltl]
MDIIQALRNNIELKIDAVMLDVNLLHVDLRKVTDKVTAAKGQIKGLQAVNKQLEKQVRDLTKKQTEMELFNNSSNPNEPLRVAWEEYVGPMDEDDWADALNSAIEIAIQT